MVVCLLSLWRGFWGTAWTLFQSLWYFAVIGTVLAHLVKRFLPVSRWSGGLVAGDVRSVAVATVAGAALPLCACGVIPFLVTFLRIGAPLAVVMAFTAASPLMDPYDFLITAGVLGTRWAIVKTLSALAMGLLVGLVTLARNRRGQWLNEIKVRVAESHAIDDGPRMLKWLIPLNELWYSAKFLLLAIALGALVHTVVPARIVVGLLGGRHWYSIPLGSLLGIATYGISSVPFVKIVLGMGMSPGAGMAFLIAGHATSVGLLATLRALVKRRIFLFYLASTVAISLIFGFGFQMA